MFGVYDICPWYLHVDTRSKLPAIFHSFSCSESSGMLTHNEGLYPGCCSREKEISGSIPPLPPCTTSTFSFQSRGAWEWGYIVLHSPKSPSWSYQIGRSCTSHESMTSECMHIPLYSTSWQCVWDQHESVTCTYLSTVLHDNVSEMFAPCCERSHTLHCDLTVRDIKVLQV